MAESIRLTEQLKLALAYADESSKRVRSIMFLLQLAVVLVVAGVWQQAESNWLRLRIDRAAQAVRILACHPDEILLDPDDPKIKMSTNLHEMAEKTAEKAKADLSCIAADEADEHEREKHPERYSANYSDAEIKRTSQYLQPYNFSLDEAKKNLESLRQLRNSRSLGLGVPILGIVFDVNDLSILGAVTFSILLSWLHFSLRREKKNVQRVFSIAERADKGRVADGDDNQFKTLRVAYDLLAMSQVFTIPPGTELESRNVSRWRLWTRVPSVIMWTAAVAEIIVLIDDHLTMSQGDMFSPLVSHSETALATYLFFYITYRTVTCLKLTRETYAEWVRVHNISKQHPIIKSDISEPGKWTLRIWEARFRLTAALLVLLALVHTVEDDWSPIYFALYNKVHWYHTLDGVQWFGLVILLATIVLCAAVHRAWKMTNYFAWFLLLLTGSDVACHIMKTSSLAMPTGFVEYMDGFYTSPLLMFGVGIFLLLTYRNVSGSS